MASSDGWDCCNIFEAVAPKIAMRHWGKLLKHTFEARFVFVLLLFLLVQDSVCTLSETRRPLSGFTTWRSRIVIESKVGTTCCEPMRWAGNVARMGEGRGLHRVLVGKPEGKRPLGRPRRRWKDNIKMDLEEVGGGCGDWMKLAQDRDRWRALVSTVMNFRVP